MQNKKILNLFIIVLVGFTFFAISDYGVTEYLRSFKRLTYYDSVKYVVKNIEFNRGCYYILSENNDSLIISLGVKLLNNGDTIIKSPNSSSFTIKNDSITKTHELKYLEFNDWLHDKLGKRETVSNRGVVSIN
ncbi:hypothetical protein EI427_21645 [Flammeovirga pectinis]|uniref:Uncharacterized protein n=1 Tax=Flammeovirga pectinis TaxID=2494373 RepID=A0A3S9P9S3_9BACT|nr:hypothetical protein [Flammeovirga pectinis]AZQ64832.1 hypothetical protein EI427_21645 [Flammeovirga pectinis]